MKILNQLFKSPMRAKFILNWLWPAWWFTGIKVTHISADYRRISVRMALRFYNRNYVGTQFGGNLFAMTDPFYMLMLLQNLPKKYIIWDKAGHIEFVAPGRGCVYAQFNLTENDLNNIQQQAETQHSLKQPFTIEVKDEQDTLIARVTKTIYIRKKSKD
jgi:acyl-coenzyme A thioesterase PaaI-like protein